jgi:site-specific recombinase XerD
VKQLGRRLGNWLELEQAGRLLDGADGETLHRKRDCAMIAVLLGCGCDREGKAVVT